MTNPHPEGSALAKLYNTGAKIAERWNLYGRKKKAMKEIVKHFRSALSFYRHCDADGKRRPTCITQKELAAKTVVAQSSVSRALRVNAGQVETLIGLAEACDVPAAVFLRKVADLASGTGEETRAVSLHELDDMRIDRDSLEEDLANARGLMELYKQEADQLRARSEVSP